jgi:hypothetical protein
MFSGGSGRGVCPRFWRRAWRREIVWLPKQEAGGVQGVTAEVGQDELLQLFQEGLVGEDRESRDHVDARPEGLADDAGIEDPF